jgi:hypothetical protein
MIYAACHMNCTMQYKMKSTVTRHKGHAAIHMCAARHMCADTCRGAACNITHAASMPHHTQIVTNVAESGALINTENFCGKQVSNSLKSSLAALPRPSGSLCAGLSLSLSLSLSLHPPPPTHTHTCISLSTYTHVRACVCECSRLCVSE